MDPASSRSKLSTSRVHTKLCRDPRRAQFKQSCRTSSMVGLPAVTFSRAARRIIQHCSQGPNRLPRRPSPPPHHLGSPAHHQPRRGCPCSWLYPSCALFLALISWLDLTSSSRQVRLELKSQHLLPKLTLNIIEQSLRLSAPTVTPRLAQPRDEKRKTPTYIILTPWPAEPRRLSPRPSRVPDLPTLFRIARCQADFLSPPPPALPCALRRRNNEAVRKAVDASPFVEVITVETKVQVVVSLCDDSALPCSGTPQPICGNIVALSPEPSKPAVAAAAPEPVAPQPPVLCSHTTRTQQPATSRRSQCGSTRLRWLPP